MFEAIILIPFIDHGHAVYRFKRLYRAKNLLSKAEVNLSNKEA